MILADTFAPYEVVATVIFIVMVIAMLIPGKKG